MCNRALFTFGAHHSRSQARIRTYQGNTTCHASGPRQGREERGERRKEGRVGKPLSPLRHLGWISYSPATPTPTPTSWSREKASRRNFIYRFRRPPLTLKTASTPINPSLGFFYFIFLLLYFTFLGKLWYSMAILVVENFYQGSSGSNKNFFVTKVTEIVLKMNKSICLFSQWLWCIWKVFFTFLGIWESNN